MKIKNKQIVIMAENLINSFNDNTKYFPAKIIFIIHKNLMLLENLAEEIYQIRDNIVNHYGTLEDEKQNTFFIPEHDRKQAQAELDELLELEQEVPLITIHFKQIKDLEFTLNQMKALMPMIEEDEEDQVE